MSGIFGAFGPHSFDAADAAQLALFALQHRGEKGSGIVSANKMELKRRRGLGLVSRITIGHVLRPNNEKIELRNVQPITVSTTYGDTALAFDGFIINAETLKLNLLRSGLTFQSASQAELILALCANSREPNIVAALVQALKQIQGAYSLVCLTKSSLIVARDPSGRRPLALASSTSGATLAASETCCFDLLDATYDSEVEPGEVIKIDDSGTSRCSISSQGTTAGGCAFEHIYRARPDSKVFGEGVYPKQVLAGQILARQSPATSAEIVIAVPDSGMGAAEGFSVEARLPRRQGLVRHHYYYRSNRLPVQSDLVPDLLTRIKLNVVSDVVRGKCVVLVVDSIRKGLTIKRAIKLVRKAGAREIHVRVASPLVIAPCYYGVGNPDGAKLIGVTTDNPKILMQTLGADSLAFLTLEALREILGQNCCTSCFTGDYGSDQGAIELRSA
jgi:amidophosphoribosyltransferase